MITPRPRPINHASSPLSRFERFMRWRGWIRAERHEAEIAFTINAVATAEEVDRLRSAQMEATQQLYEFVVARWNEDQAKWLNEDVAARHQRDCDGAHSVGGVEAVMLDAMNDRENEDAGKCKRCGSTKWRLTDGLCTPCVVGDINSANQPLDLEAIRQRARDFFGLYHPTVGPCRCSSCNPVAHSAHPLHEMMSEVRRDHNALLAEVERLRELLSRATALRPYTANDRP